MALATLHHETNHSGHFVVTLLALWLAAMLLSACSYVVSGPRFSIYVFANRSRHASAYTLAHKACGSTQAPVEADWQRGALGLLFHDASAADELLGES